MNGHLDRRQFLTATALAVTAPHLAARQPPPEPLFRVRPNVLSLNAVQWESLRRGIAAMKALPKENPKSWWFQAAMHGNNDDTQSPLFDHCQHGNLHFLPWHRAYLYYFEQILRDASGDPTLNLPYWDWATFPVLPEPFRFPADASNPLYDGTRAINDGTPLTPNVVGSDLNRALQAWQFDGPIGFSRLFEWSPHGAIHVQIDGNMSAFETAGLDPIFWLHHCNIDRLWNVWLNLGAGRMNPLEWGPASPPDPYVFANAAGETVTVEVASVVSSSQLGYQYEGVANPFIAFAKAKGFAPPKAPPVKRMATSTAVDRLDVPLGQIEAQPLGYAVRRIPLNSPPDARAALKKPVKLRRMVGERPPQHIVTIEGITADKLPGTTFEVYLNLPAAEERDPNARARYYLGSLDFFGKAGGPKKKAAHAHAADTDGFAQSFDATEVIARMQREQRWDPANLSIVIIPINTQSPRATVEQVQAKAAAALQAANVRFKRVTLSTTGDNE